MPAACFCKAPQLPRPGCQPLPRPLREGPSKMGVAAAPAAAEKLPVGTRLTRVPHQTANLAAAAKIASAAPPFIGSARSRRGHRAVNAPRNTYLRCFIQPMLFQSRAHATLPLLPAASPVHQAWPQCLPARRHSPSCSAVASSDHSNSSRGKRTRLASSRLFSQPAVAPAEAIDPGELRIESLDEDFSTKNGGLRYAKPLSTIKTALITQ